jgi:hypothetical protein
MTPPVSFPKQTIYNETFISVAPTPDGLLLQISVPKLGEQLLFPMSAEAAREIGQKMIAPHVVPAAAGAPNGNGKAG